MVSKSKLPIVNRWIFLSTSLLFSTIYSETIDNQLWSGIEFQKNISNNLELEFGQYLRMKDQFTQFHKTFTDFALNYQLNSIFEFSCGYRYLIYDDKKRHRINLDLKLEIESLEYFPNLRISFQKELPDEFLILRDKLSIDLPKISKLKPYCMYEGFYSTFSNEISLYKNRIGIGFELDLSKINSVKFYYYYQEELDNNEIETTFIWGSKYEHNF